MENRLIRANKMWNCVDFYKDTEEEKERVREERERQARDMNSPEKREERLQQFRDRMRKGRQDK